MATNNVLKFAPRPKKPAPPSGQPSPIAIIVTAIVTIAIVAAIWWVFNH